MKNKMILSIAVLFIIGIMIISKKNITNLSDSSTFSYNHLDLQPSHQIDKIIYENVDEIKTETKEQKIIEKPSCSLEIIETDTFTFGDAFKYYRNCNPNDNFSWKGQVYTTKLNIETDIQLTNESKEKNEYVSETD